MEDIEEFQKLSEFIDLAEKNRKYPANTAHGRRAALHLFDTVLTQEEKESLELIEERMKEIYLNLISKHKDAFSIASLNTYKGRFLKVIQDYKRYGANPDDMIHWEVKQRGYTVRNLKDIKKDTPIHNISFPTHTGVHKLQIVLENGLSCNIEAPSGLNKKDASKIKGVFDALSQ